MALFRKQKIVHPYKITKRYSFCGFCFLVKEKGLLDQRIILFGHIIHKEKAQFSEPVFPSAAQELLWTSPHSLMPRHRRLAVFASFSGDGKIADYVIYHLRKLQKVTDGIVFVTDNPLLPEELTKIQDLVIHVDCQRHREYDFGSYKRGFNYLQQQGLLDQADELVLCNDSCYGPVFPWENTWKRMSEKNCDFWGLTSNKDFRWHIQSYFYVFKSQVFRHKSFEIFLNRVRQHKAFQYIVLHYEIQFTRYLQKQGFQPGVLLPLEAADEFICNNTTLFPHQLMSDYQIPLIKIKAFKLSLPNVPESGKTRAIDFIHNHNPELYSAMAKHLNLNQ